jgi:hypothetical protein
MKLTSIILFVGVIGGAISLYNQFSGAKAKEAEMAELCASQARGITDAKRRPLICTSWNAQQQANMRTPPRG